MSMRGSHDYMCAPVIFVAVEHKQSKQDSECKSSVLRMAVSPQVLLVTCE